MSWPLVPLGETAKFIRGITFKPTDVVNPRTEGSVVCMRTKNVQAALDERDLLAIPQSFVKRREQMLQDGDLLVSSANSWNLVGKCCWIENLSYSATAGGFISILRANEAVVFPRYLYHWFSSRDVQDLVRNCGRQTTNISNLDFVQCLALEMPLPPLADQQRITAILDKADALRHKRRDALSHLDRLLHSIFVEMFGDPMTNPKGWKIHQVSEVGQVQGGLTLNGSRSGLPFKKPYLRVANVQRGRLDLSEIKEIGLTPQEFERTVLQPNDLLIVEGNGNPNEIGRTALWNGKVRDCVHQNHLIRVRCKSDFVMPEYLSYFVNSSAGRDYFNRIGRTTSGLVTISTGTVKLFPVPLPPLADQQKFAAIVEQVESLRARQIAAQTEADALFAALQARAFAGEL